MEPDREEEAVVAAVAWEWDVAEELVFADKDNQQRLRRSQ